ncbi:hypothetical protein E2562_038340 [Oryza meyeriana var. granulata]|uniref:Uncharacterized protein n=1 Tax=Oryza meyeriana var. granulata TaxID=110450 RepID=A0A6G1FGT0_9ORYZ|nr:hypothetical protein E2562_038340 [Oryza meyeriana var. granulata]
MNASSLSFASFMAALLSPPNDLNPPKPLTTAKTRLSTMNRGTMRLRLNRPDDKEYAYDFEDTIESGDHIVILEKVEDCEASFTQPMERLYELDILDYPDEHRPLFLARQVLSGLGLIAEIDEECMYGEDYSSFRVVVQHQHEKVFPSYLRIWNRHAPSTLARVTVIASWERILNIDDGGHYWRHFLPYASLPPPPLDNTDNTHHQNNHNPHAAHFHDQGANQQLPPRYPNQALWLLPDIQPLPLQATSPLLLLPPPTSPPTTLTPGSQGSSHDRVNKPLGSPARSVDGGLSFPKPDSDHEASAKKRDGRKK